MAPVFDWRAPVENRRYRERPPTAGWWVARTVSFHSRDPSDSASDADRDGYTAIEEFINGTDPQPFVDYRKS